MKRKFMSLQAVLLVLLLAACTAAPAPSAPVAMDDLPPFTGEPYVVVNDNEPYFTQEELTEEVFETYSDLDSLGRCGVAYANLCRALMPTEERGSIGQVKPTGWQTVKYDFVDGKYLYNRCHLIGFQLAGENANEKNLITGTRYLNVDGMLPFENMVADYIKETDNHVLYRVTPVYEGENLVAAGVLMEAWSVEDGGEGVCFNVYCYNNMPGVEIDYATGLSAPAGAAPATPDTVETGTIGGETVGTAYVLNTSSQKFHLPTCASVADIKPGNQETYLGDRAELLDRGYEPCGRCKP